MMQRREGKWTDMRVKGSMLYIETCTYTTLRENEEDISDSAEGGCFVL